MGPNELKLLGTKTKPPQQTRNYNRVKKPELDNTQGRSQPTLDNFLRVANQLKLDLTEKNIDKEQPVWRN